MITDDNIQIKDNKELRLGDSGNDILIASDGTNVHQTNNGYFTIGDGGATNYVKFAASTGVITLVGTARVTKKEFIPAGAFVSHTGSPALTQVGTGDAYGWGLDDAADESITTFWRVPQDWDSSSAMTANIFWISEAAVAGNCRMDLFTLGLVESETVDAAGNQDTVTDTTDGTAKDLNITANITIAASELAAGDMVTIRINRDADHAGDTLVGDAVILGLQISYTSNALGS